LTDKICRESGICNIKTQLQSEFFTDISQATSVSTVSPSWLWKASPAELCSTAAVGRRLRAVYPRPYHRRRRQSLYGCPAAAGKANTINADRSVSVVSVVADSVVRHPYCGMEPTSSQFGLGLAEGIDGVAADNSSGGGDSAIITSVVVVSCPVLAGYGSLCFCIVASY
jgi:hypothetical protein